MRRYLSLALLLLLPVMLTAQQSILLKEKNIYKDKTSIVLEYSIDIKGYDWCEVALYVSFDGGRTFSDRPMASVVGDVGRITTSGDKRMIWVLGKQIDSYAGRDISFKINVERSRKSKAPKTRETAVASTVPVYKPAATVKPTTPAPVQAPKPKAAKKPIERKPATFIMAEVAGIKPLSYGLMIGWSSPKFGFYVKALSNFNFASTELVVDDAGKIVDGTGYIFATGKTAYSMLMGTAGILIPMGKVAYLNMGVGYGSRSYLWETSAGEWAKVQSSSTASVAADLGLIFKIKKFAISVGAGYIVPNSISGQIGIGVAF